MGFKPLIFNFCVNKINRYVIISALSLNSLTNIAFIIDRQNAHFRQMLLIYNVSDWHVSKVGKGSGFTHHCHIVETLTTKYEN